MLKDGVYYGPQEFMMPTSDLPFCQIRLFPALKAALALLSCPELNAFTEDPALFRNSIGAASPRRAEGVVYSPDFMGITITAPEEFDRNFREIFPATFYTFDPTGLQQGVRVAEFIVRNAADETLGGYRVLKLVKIVSAEFRPEVANWYPKEVEYFDEFQRLGTSPEISRIQVKGGFLFDLALPGAATIGVYTTDFLGNASRMALNALQHFSPNFVFDHFPQCFDSPRLRFRMGFGASGKGILEDATPESPMIRDCLGVLANYTGSIKGE